MDWTATRSAHLGRRGVPNRLQGSSPRLKAVLVNSNRQIPTVVMWREREMCVQSVATVKGPRLLKPTGERFPFTKTKVIVPQRIQCVTGVPLPRCRVLWLCSGGCPLRFHQGERRHHSTTPKLWLFGKCPEVIW